MDYRMTNLNLADLDVVFISYDEPKKELYYADLLSKAEWAMRVDGVIGFNAAHVRAGEVAETEYVITVDGDNLVDERLFDVKLDIPASYQDHVLSWAAINSVNGLCYGNGGIKIWPRDALLNLKSHEAAEDELMRVDFCWGIRYLHMAGSYSTTYPNNSPLQAFRSGFREGSKMCIYHGERIDPETYTYRVWTGNKQRLLIWCSVGLDVDNGDWCMLGARMGAVWTLTRPEWDHAEVSDYRKIEQIFNDLGPEVIDSRDARFDMMDKLGRQFRAETGLDMPVLGESESRMFKFCYNEPYVRGENFERKA